MKKNKDARCGSPKVIGIKDRTVYFVRDLSLVRRVAVILQKDLKFPPSNVVQKKPQMRTPLFRSDIEAIKMCKLSQSFPDVVPSSNHRRRRRACCCRCSVRCRRRRRRRGRGRRRQGTPPWPWPPPASSSSRAQPQARQSSTPV